MKDKHPPTIRSIAMNFEPDKVYVNPHNGDLYLGREIDPTDGEIYFEVDEEEWIDPQLLSDAEDRYYFNK